MQSKFRFGIEAEFLLMDAASLAPLWHDSLSFSRLNEIFEGISLDGLPSCEGLELKPPMRRILPFVVEGYALPNSEFLPKGVEIRTPICSSPEECLKVLGELHRRLSGAMLAEGMALVALSHHPVASRFSAPQNDSRHDYWQWGMEVMTTYGPDINISLPSELADRIDLADLDGKINHYGPALAALTAASPFCESAPWKIRGEAGKSFRMHKRSYIAPAFEFHPEEDRRIEFKLFDMPGSLEEFGALMLVSLSLLLDESLLGRAAKQTRIYDLGQVARFGLEADEVHERLVEVLERAPEVLAAHGFDPLALRIFRHRLASGITPADEMLRIYARENNLKDVLRARSLMGS